MLPWCTKHPCCSFSFIYIKHVCRYPCRYPDFIGFKWTLLKILNCGSHPNATTVKNWGVELFHIQWHSNFRYIWHRLHTMRNLEWWQKTVICSIIPITIFIKSNVVTHDWVKCVTILWSVMGHSTSIPYQKVYMGPPLRAGAADQCGLLHQSVAPSTFRFWWCAVKYLALLRVVYSASETNSIKMILFYMELKMCSCHPIPVLITFYLRGHCFLSMRTLICGHDIQAISLESMNQ